MIPNKPSLRLKIAILKNINFEETKNMQANSTCSKWLMVFIIMIHKNIYLSGCREAILHNSNNNSSKSMRQKYFSMKDIKTLHKLVKSINQYINV